MTDTNPKRIPLKIVISIFWSASWRQCLYAIIAGLIAGALWTFLASAYASHSSGASDSLAVVFGGLLCILAIASPVLLVFVWIWALRTSLAKNHFGKYIAVTDAPDELH